MEITTPHGTLEGESIKAILAKYGRDCLCGADLTNADLTGADLHDANLHGADLIRADLSYANLRDADLRDADLTGADLCRADLRCANLRDAYLIGADLRRTDLSRADLSRADLRRANLHGANLCDADLTGANLSYANLRDAKLTGANLRAADLSYANLSGAKLSGAKLSGADITNADGADLIIARTCILPDDGDIIGWKKAWIDGRMSFKTPVIVKLLVPSDAQRSNATGRKCRASKAQVLDLQDLDGHSLKPDTTAYSRYDTDFIYKKGETVTVEDFDPDRWNECAPGIHFFVTRIEAVEY